MRNLLYAIPRPGCIFRHAEKRVAKCTGINSSRLKFSPYGEKRKFHELNGPKGPGRCQHRWRTRLLEPGFGSLQLGQTLSWARSAREMVSPSGVAGVALRGLDDLPACPRPRCPFWLPRATCPERLAPKNITLVEPPGTCLRFLKTGRRHHLET